MGMIPTNEAINAAFAAGRGIEYGLHPEDSQNMHAELAVVGEYLGKLPLEHSFAWTDEQPIRRSVWLAGKQHGDGFATTEEELARTDGDMVAGRRGLEFLRQDAVIEPLNRLKWRADGPNGSLRLLWEWVAAAHGIGVEALQEGKVGPYAAAGTIRRYIIS